MKKRLVTFAMVMSMVIPCAFWVEGGKTQVYAAELGDVNADGKIDVSDAVIIKQSIAKVAGVSIDVSIADVDASGNIDVTDAVLVMQNIAGIVGNFKDEIAEQKAIKAAVEAGINGISKNDLDAAYDYSDLPVMAYAQDQKKYTRAEFKEAMGDSPINTLLGEEGELTFVVNSASYIPKNDSCSFALLVYEKDEDGVSFADEVAGAYNIEKIAKVHMTATDKSGNSESGYMYAMKTDGQWRFAYMLSFLAGFADAIGGM